MTERRDRVHEDDGHRERDRDHEDDGHRERDHEDDGRRSDGHHDSQDHGGRHGHERHDTARHSTVPDHGWAAADWFGDDAGQTAVGCADAATDQPAMAVLVTRSHDEPGSDLTTQRIDSRTLLTVLDDLEAADGPAPGCAVPHARGA